MTLLEEIQNGETETLEFKREIPSKDSKLMKTVVAFSNCHGRLYGGLTIEKMLKGSSSIRNELIADTFLRMGIVEKWGTGIKRIADLCYEHGLGEVEYSSDDESFTAIIRRTRKDLFGENVPKTSPEMSLCRTERNQYSRFCQKRMIRQQKIFQTNWELRKRQSRGILLN